MDQDVDFFSDKFHQYKITDTYTISIGLKNEAHDCIERQFVDELNELKSGINNIYYSKYLKRNVHVYFEVIASLGDQPERREQNYLMNGNSNIFHKIQICCKFQFIAQVLQFMKIL